MGPEHSSGRLERFLQSSNQATDIYPTEEEYQLLIQSHNAQICNITTPANYFHVLRRQIYRDFRKPLIIMSPKSLLRHPLAKSTLQEMSSNTSFQSVIGEHLLNTDDDMIRKHIFCSGKVYYDLLNYRNKHNINDVAITRIEQIAPFPFHHVANEINRYKNVEQIIWCQEEPENMGAWFFTRNTLTTTLKHNQLDIPIDYVGRKPSASTATGFANIHNAEQDQLVQEAFQ